MTETSIRSRGFLGVAALLLIGVAMGVALDRSMLAPRTGQAAASPQDHGVVVLSLTRDLGLDEAQAQEVMGILERHQVVVNQAWEGTHRTLLAALDSVTNQIESILEPEQVERYHAWIDRRHPPGDPRRPNHQPH